MRSAAATALILPVLLAAQQKPDIRVDVDLVTVACSVTDQNDAPAKELKREDFNLSDNGQAREIHNFWQELDLPLTIALVADVSGSQAGFVRNHREAIAQFLTQVIGPGDRAMIVEVNQQARLIADLTGSLEGLHVAVGEIGTREGAHAPVLGPPCRNSRFPRSCGGTALWHGLYYTARELKSVRGRKAIVVLSDGMDTGSDIGLTDLIEAAESAETVVYSIKYASPARFVSIGAMLSQALSHGLERLDRETGGVTFPNPGRKTSEVFARIESDLRNMYVLGFTPPGDARDGKFHKLDVKIAPNEFSVRCRAGYWANPG
jgi:Ca-activated chloride channel family protein